MARVLSTTDLVATLTGKIQRPTIVMWNRLEGRPRTRDFSRALKAEARDSLWMLTRQWQMGEFEGDDAGSPAGAKIAWRTEAVDGLQNREGQRLDFDAAMPVEAQVEARPVPLARGDRMCNANLRVAMGRHWQKVLVREGHGGLVPDFVRDYGFEAPDPTKIEDAELTASAGTWQYLAALAGRAIDGGKLIAHLAGGGHASDGMGLGGGAASALDLLGDAFVAWVQTLYVAPHKDLNAWIVDHLEYGFGVNAPDGAGATALQAPEYHGGRLDWFHFDAAEGAADGGGAPRPGIEATSFLPVQLQFDGMPNTRHWAFEESAVNFGDIAPDTTDLPKLLLIEFGLVYANDWFLLPMDLPAGSLTRIEGLRVTNVFGERSWIEPAVSRAGPEDSWQMFRLTDKGVAEDRLFVPAVAPVGLESQPVEAVDFVRDEVSNMVWGVERVVQTADGAARRGRGVGQEVRAWHQARVVAPAPGPVQENEAKIRYQLMQSVPEHWIPMIPVHVPGSNREIQLQRGAMPRLLESADDPTPDKIEPRTGLLREGLDLASQVPWFLAEEEVSRAGTVVEERWQRVRWRKGRVVLWLGMKRSTGRGETSSGLAFDQVRPKPRPPAT